MTRTVSRNSPRDRVQRCQPFVSILLGSVLLLMPTQLHAQIAEKERCGNGELATLQGVDVLYRETRFAICAQQVELTSTEATGTWHVTGPEFELVGQVLALLPPSTDDFHHTWCVQYDYGDHPVLNPVLKGKQAIWWIRDVGDGVTALDQVRTMQFDVGTWSCENPPRFISGATLDPVACIHMDDFVKGNPNQMGQGCFQEIGGGDFAGKMP